MKYGEVEERISSRSRSPNTARRAATSAILTVILSRSDRAPTLRTVKARPPDGMRIQTLTDVRLVESAVVRVATIISINKAKQAGLERNPGTGAARPLHSYVHSSIF